MAIIEIYYGSYEDAFAAFNGGAKRIDMMDYTGISQVHSACKNCTFCETLHA